MDLGLDPLPRVNISDNGFRRAVHLRGWFRRAFTAVSLSVYVDHGQVGGDRSDGKGTDRAPSDRETDVLPGTGKQLDPSHGSGCEALQALSPRSQQVRECNVPPDFRWICQFTALSPSSLVHKETKPLRVITGLCLSCPGTDLTRLC